MMTNDNCVKEFVKGDMRYGYSGHIGFTENRLYSYNTCICEINRNEKIARMNVTKYSRTTSKHQNTLQYHLISNGYNIIDCVHSDLNNGRVIWENFGYMGAIPNKASDFK